MIAVKVTSPLYTFSCEDIVVKETTKIIVLLIHLPNIKTIGHSLY